MLFFTKKIIFIFFALLFQITIYASSFNISNDHKSTWQWLDIDNDGVYECYYFNVLGNIYKNGTTPDGNKVNELGQLVIDNQVQRKTLFELHELFNGKLNIPATVSNTTPQIILTENGVVIELKDEFNNRLNDYILEKVRELQIYISSKDIDKRLLVDLQAAYVKNMNKIYNEYYINIIKLYNENNITKKDLNDAKKMIADLYDEKERQLKSKINLMSNEITWEFDKTMLKEKRDFLFDNNY